MPFDGPAVFANRWVDGSPALKISVVASFTLPVAHTCRLPATLNVHATPSC